MTITAHTSIGCAIGLAFGDPVAGFFAGWLSHHIADSIPHSDLGSVGANIENVLKDAQQMKWVYIDIIFAAIIFCVFIFSQFPSFWAIFWGAFGAILPDAIDNSPFWSQYTRKIFPTNLYHRFHEIFHYTIKSRRHFIYGLLTQAIMIVASLSYLMVKSF